MEKLNGIVNWVKVALTDDNVYNLYILVLSNGGKDYMLDARIVFRYCFVSNSYTETRYIMSTISLFGNKQIVDIDCLDFEISEKEIKPGKMQKSLVCKIIQEYTLNKKDATLYLNRGRCKAMSEIFYESIQGFSKAIMLERAKILNGISIGGESSLYRCNIYLSNLDLIIPDEIRYITRDLFEKNQIT